MRLAYVLGALGPGSLDFKLQWLKNNLILLRRQVKVDLFIHDYSEGGLAVTGATVYHLPRGELAQMWSRAKFDLSGYDYVLLILDDVRLGRNMDDSVAPFDIRLLVRKLEKYDCDIISPFIHNPTHSSNFLQQPYVTITIGGSLEFFCYLMKPSTYSRYIKVVNKNYFLWGIDLYLEQVGFKVGVDCQSHAHHMIKMGYNPRQQQYREKLMYSWMTERGFSGKQTFDF